LPDFLPFVIFGVLFVALVAWLVLKNRASTAARARKLELLGFLPCAAEAGTLADRVTWLENNAEYQLSVENPMRASLQGKTSYYDSKSRRRHGQVTATEELLFPLTRPSSDGFMLFVKPSNLPAGTATRLIGAVASGAWDSQPDDLTKLDIPIELEGSNVIGAMGPAGASLYDLIDSQTLTVLQQVGDGGALIVRGRGEWCSLSGPGGRFPFNVDKLWPLIQRLV
jgi:hypothetical protein